MLVDLTLLIRWWRMIFIWSVYSGITGYLLSKASQNALEKDMPRYFDLKIRNSHIISNCVSANSSRYDTWIVK